MPKGFTKNGRTRSKVPNVLDQSTPDLFGDSESDDVAIDWGAVRPENLHTVISRVCRVGGYISFSAPTGGEAVKFSVSIGGSAGHKWCHSGPELAGYITKAHNALSELERGLRDSTRVANQPSGPAVDKSNP